MGSRDRGYIRSDSTDASHHVMVARRMGVFSLARIGELTSLNWVVGHVLPYLVFALIVVFQSEIRHVPADLGRRLTFLGGSSAESDSYDDIVLAANLFSQHQ